MPVPSQNLDIQHHNWCHITEILLKVELNTMTPAKIMCGGLFVTFHFVDIGEIVDHHCLNLSKNLL